jgi:microcystin-dependent protein
MLCDGRQLLKSEYPALFNVIGERFTSITGTEYFNIPDFRGRVNAMPKPINQIDTNLGTRVGEETVTLTVQQMPSHTHTNNSVANLLGLATQNGFNTAGGGLDNTPGEPNLYEPVKALTIGSTGNNLPHNNMQPTLFGGNVYILSRISPYSTLSPLNVTIQVESTFLNQF